MSKKIKSELYVSLLIWVCFIMPQYIFSQESNMPLIKLESKIDEVTVFIDRAQVKRSAPVDLKKGEQEVIFMALPAAIEKNSIQVSGKGNAIIKNVRLETKYFTETLSLEAAKLGERKKELEEESAKYQDFINEAKKEQKFIENITKKLTATGGEKEQVELDPEKWIKMVEFYRTKNNSINDEVRNFRTKINTMQLEIDKINRELNELGSEGSKSQNNVHVILDIKETGTMRLDLSYIVYGPSWIPDYDLRVESLNKTMDIAYNAQIKQNTGEDWRNIRLNLSTAKPQIGGKMPELTPWYLKYETPPSEIYRSETMKKEKKAMMNQMIGSELDEEPEADKDELEDMEYLETSAQTGATAVVFNIGGYSTIDSDNKNHKVTISILQFPAYFRYSTVPKLSPYAYLKAKVKNNSDFPYLPGETHIYLDGSFVANSSMDLVAPAQEFWTFLGIDEGIKVERKLIKKYKEPVNFNKKSKITFEYLLVIENLKKTEEEIVIWDQLPISNNKEIAVQLLKPEYSKDSESLKKNEYDFFEWFSKLKPGDKVEIPFSYLVTYPADQILSNIE